MSSLSEIPVWEASSPIHAKGLDERGDTSPLRLLRAWKAIELMDPEEVLTVVTSDEASLREYRVLARLKNLRVISQEQVGDVYVHLLAQGDKLAAPSSRPQ